MIADFELQFWPQQWGSKNAAPRHETHVTFSDELRSIAVVCPPVQQEIAL
jgi:hypothetical protein